MGTYQFVGDHVEENDYDGTCGVWKLQRTVILEDKKLTSTLVAFFSILLNFLLAVIAQSINNLVLLAMSQIGSKYLIKYTTFLSLELLGSSSKSSFSSLMFWG